MKVGEISSLLIMRIIARLSKQHSIDLTFRAFLQHRTVRGLAGTISASRESSPLIWLGETGAGTPLFCVHPGGGSAHWYRNLADVCTGVRPVAAFEWPGLHSDAPAPASLADVAATYVTELRQARPGGPHHILGWCGSSGIAWEMARQLRAAGEQPRLILIDPIEYPSTGVNPLAENVVMLRRAEALLAALPDLPHGSHRDETRAELMDVLSTIIDDGDSATTLAELDLDHGWTKRLRSWREMAELRLHYRFPKYPGSVDLLICERLADGGYEDIVGQGFDGYLDQWRRLAVGGVRSQLIPGDHQNALFPPHVSMLAARLTAIIDRPDSPEE